MSARTRLHALEQRFGDALRRNEPVARYTSARIGGPADLLIVADDAAALRDAAQAAWNQALPLTVLGAGSNVLVADAGIDGLVVINRAGAIAFADDTSGVVTCVAESGAMLPTLARAAIRRGAGGLAWAATVPGTLGGAIFGNAGAHGGDMTNVLHTVTVLQATSGERSLTMESVGFDYRSSAFKRGELDGLILSATLTLPRSTPAEEQQRLDEFVAHRKRSQPPGATIGSMFKNPPGDYAGRLIDTCGLKGYRVGQAQISERHANFFVNIGDARAADVLALIRHAQHRVAETHGTSLALEVELKGRWPGDVSGRGVNSA